MRRTWPETLILVALVLCLLGGGAVGYDELRSRRPEHCAPRLPDWRNGRCPNRAHLLHVEDGVAVCTCHPERLGVIVDVVLMVALCAVAAAHTPPGRLAVASLWPFALVRRAGC